MPDLDPAVLLAAYDSQLREEAEVATMAHVERHGPLLWARSGSGRGFVTYRDLDGATGVALRELVSATVAHYAADPEVASLEWKTRGHDHAPGLHELLLEHGFEPEEPESVMVGRAEDLVGDAPLPDGVVVRQVSEPDDVRRMCAMADVAFGRPFAGMADHLVHRMQSADSEMEIWVAEVDGEIVSCGRLEPVAGTDFAGLWGGATLAEWRSRGIYRALTAERARSALRRGRTLVNSDSTEYSRPILERAGLVKVTTTTPYEWSR
ncbi:GNAT family N-acetyltransferase [Nocardioides plantarum]|uniref:GNAT family N-acetyltransferase n=1 Tax=Nocardioides plantarum TaxID=29299 RepID=A0ABV5K740_9ACTN|nr:GNAT family N-acetyltransferase [Nocardioides plantarum]